MGIKEMRKAVLSVRTEVTVQPIIVRKMTLILTETTKKEAGFIWEGNRISLRL